MGKGCHGEKKNWENYIESTGPLTLFLIVCLKANDCNADARAKSTMSGTEGTDQVPDSVSPGFSDTEHSTEEGARQG